MQGRVGAGEDPLQVAVDSLLEEESRKGGGRGGGRGRRGGGGGIEGGRCVCNNTGGHSLSPT